MKYAFPANYGKECIIIALDKALVPLVAGALKPFEQAYTWVSDEDYEQGYNAFVELQASFMNSCLKELIESNNRIYRLLDTALNGEVYTALPDPLKPTETIVTPALPAAPLASSPAALPAWALRRRLERLINLVDNQSTGANFPLVNPGLSEGALTDTYGLRRTIRLLVAGYATMPDTPETHNALTYLNILSTDVKAILEALETAESMEEIKVLLGELLVLLG